MKIDTDDITNWIKMHLQISVPIGMGFFSWYSALRWQAACSSNQFALMVYYFCTTAASGVVTMALIVKHLKRLGFL